jgi:methionyl-tRNA synthetase
VHFGNDAQFSQDLVIARVNSELANNLGNLLNRTTNLVEKFFTGTPPPLSENHAATVELKQAALKVADLVRNEILAMSPNKAVGHVVDLLNLANKYLEEQAPWKTAKTDLATAGESLRTALEVLRIAGILLRPVMPEKMDQLIAQVGGGREANFAQAKLWGAVAADTRVKKAEPLFPRVDAAAV